MSVSRDFFNPTLRESATLHFITESPGLIRAAVLDRDGYVVRQFPPRTVGHRQEVTIQWDGRDGEGAVVPDEAYSFKIDFEGAAGRDVYFPANGPATFSEIRPDVFDPSTGTLRYTLPHPSRVHVQAGSATVDPKSGKARGPVLKTIVNRAPRAAGSIVEHWMGFDESGTIRVPDLPHFVVSVAATDLPENSVITVGNRREDFAAFRERRKGTSLLPAHPFGHDHRHHQGLSSEDDVAPALDLQPQAATWLPADKVWKRKSDGVVAMRIALRGANAERFAKQPGRVMVFVDGSDVAVYPASAVPKTIELRVPPVTAGADHIIAVNWVSDYGPVAVSSLRLR